MEKIITLEDVTGGFNCGLENYGNIRDTIGHFNYQFKSGLYIMEGECGTGGWALSTILSGKDEFVQGKIIVDDEVVNCKDLKRYSCYVGEDSGLKKNLGLTPMSVAEQINYGISKGLSFTNNVDQIKVMFGLSNERFTRKMKYLSGERWRASMAIGYATGKFIYCFPWMNSKFITHLEDCLMKCIPPLLKINATIIIPTTKHQIFDTIIKDYKVVKLD